MCKVSQILFLDLRDKLYVHVFPVIPIEQCPCCLNYKTQNYITVQDVYDINEKCCDIADIINHKLYQISFANSFKTLW